jgi:hypothetical protein
VFVDDVVLETREVDDLVLAPRALGEDDGAVALEVIASPSSAVVVTAAAATGSESLSGSAMLAEVNGHTGERPGAKEGFWRRIVGNLFAWRLFQRR